MRTEPQTDESKPISTSVFDAPSLVTAMRDFLAAKQASAANATWTLGGWARRLKLSSSATLTNILRGRRVPNRESAERIARSMGLEGSAREFFLLLADRDRLPEDSSASRKGVERKLRALRTRGRTEAIDQARFRAVADPRHFIVREMANLRHFREDPRWIGDQTVPPLSETEVADSIRTLVRVGLLERTDGRLRVAQHFYETSRDVPTAAHREYHRTCLGLATEALDAFPVSKRDFSNSILSVPASRLPEMKKFIETFNDEFAGTFDTVDGTADTVYHLGVALYPVTNPAAPEPGHA